MIKVLNGDVKLAKNFRLSEFKCKCGCQEAMLSYELIEKLQKLRELLGKPIVITSSYRCPTYNKAVGGVTTSLHLSGLAADIKVSGVHPLAVAKEAEKLGFTGIGVYTNNNQYFTHLDVRNGKSYWVDQPSTKTLKHVTSL